jgi:transcriptional regulator with XRE-family HTH domain
MTRMDTPRLGKAAFTAIESDRKPERNSNAVVRVQGPIAGNLRRLGARLRDLRKAKLYSIEMLGELSGVSKSMISKIERSEATPSTTVLARIAEALGVTFSELMTSEQDSEVIYQPLERQPILTDPESGHTRRCLAPILPARGIDWVVNTLPPGASTGEFVPHKRGVEEYIHVLRGTLRAALGNRMYTLNEGDAIYFQAHIPHAFENCGNGPCVYYLVINSQKAR